MTLCICGKEIVTYYADGENPSMWLHTAYGQPECLSAQVATPADGENLPFVECICGWRGEGSEREYLLHAHQSICEKANQ